jgi:hypothetical protein
MSRHSFLWYVGAHLADYKVSWIKDHKITEMPQLTWFSHWPLVTEAQVSSLAIRCMIYVTIWHWQSSFLQALWFSIVTIIPSMPHTHVSFINQHYLILATEVKNQSQYRPGEALRVPGSWGSQFQDSRHTKVVKVVSPTHWLHLPPRKYSWYSFLLEAESTPGP